MDPSLRNSRGPCELYLAILQRTPRVRSPIRGLVQREIASPADRRINMSVVALMDEAEIEDRVGVVRVDLERALEAIDRLVSLALVIKEARQIVPGLGKARVRLGRGAIRRF